MGKIIFLARVLIGLGLIVFVAYSLRFFDGPYVLAFGTSLMLGGLGCGYMIERRSWRCFLAMGVVYAVLVFALGFAGHPWHFAQYFAGGYVVYFGSATLTRRFKASCNDIDIVNSDKM